ELEIDEHQFPEYAALPWEYLNTPPLGNMPAILFAGNDHLAFCRFRAGNPKENLPNASEALRIAMFTTVPIRNRETGEIMHEVFEETARLTNIREYLQLSSVPLVDNGEIVSADQAECWITDGYHPIELRL